MTALGRPSSVANLDPANDNVPYAEDAAFDVRELVDVDEEDLTPETLQAWYTSYIKCYGQGAPPPVGSDLNRAFDFHVQVDNFYSGRTLAMMENGLLCLVPPETQVGAKAVVLFGGRVPYILRPTGEYHQLEGECYVHGFMNGEAFHLVSVLIEQEDVDWSVEDPSLVRNVKTFEIQ